MPKIQFTLASKHYEIVCGEGEQQRILSLADSLNQRINNLSKSFSSASDNMLIAVTALMMEDEIGSLKEEVASAKTVVQAPPLHANDDAIHHAIADAIEPIAETLETLASALEE